MKGKKMAESMTLMERKDLEKKYGLEKIKDVFVDYIVNRKPHADVCKEHELEPDVLDDLLRVCFYQLDEAGANAVQAMDEQRLVFDAVYAKLGKGTQVRVMKALKRLTNKLDNGENPL